MPSLVRLLTRPELRRPGPPPLEVDVRTVVLWALAAWTLALVVSVVLALLDIESWSAVAVCGAGIALGGLGLLWLRGKRR